MDCACDLDADRASDVVGRCELGAAGIGVLIPAGSRDDLIGRLERALTVRQGRRGRETETRIELDHLLPSPSTGSNRPPRWRLATTTARLYPPPMSSEPMRAWRIAEGRKGRRLLAGDLREDNRVVAILAWRFESGASGGVRRPHLITAAAVRQDLDDRGDYYTLPA